MNSKASYQIVIELHLLFSPTFVWVTIAFTFMAFVVGSLTLWGPAFVADSQIVSGDLPPCTADNCNYPGYVDFLKKKTLNPCLVVNKNQFEFLLK